ncbi:putative baseplate assembly protein [Streptomyces cinnabarinus]|uniref:Baseplate assembly protein n=1 Tax=Streptomyces cinnabarinus TaxID=67287 RepID=A0ABY7K6K4_9ACTN|nr:putative baseplate assembly protein [Streptomyces cinnabarinus]WAZ20019.1 putative baseplate assembly protein [Streptomyces cinnabarinus]
MTAAAASPGAGARMPVCDSERRRAAVHEQGLAGLESVTVGADRRTLTVAYFGTLPSGLDRHSFRVEGGRRVTGIEVTDVVPHGEAEEEDEEEAHCLRLTLDRCGDASVYRLVALVRGFDSRYAAKEFTFHSAPDGLDCAPAADACPPRPSGPEPTIDYLAKDYASFRRLLLDRFSLTMPEWTERHVPDLAVTLVELLAYVGDRLSYQQDAVASEAYLDTARLRTSVRRHARLVDYPMHDGCAARAFVCLETEQETVTLPGADLAFTVLPPGRRPRPAGPVVAAGELRSGGRPVFQPVGDEEIVLRRAHNRISLWTWGDGACCLPSGATTATLRDAGPDEAGPDQEEPRRVLRLSPGDVVVFEEVLGAGTGSPADADPTHRQAVRLTEVTPGFDALSRIPVLDIAWAADDALTFPFCVSTVGPDGADREVGVVRGNTVLVEHGLLNTWADGDPEELTPSAGRLALTLRGLPVSRSAPCPRPADIATAQARALARLPETVRDRLLQLRGSDTTLEEADRAFLHTLFGPRVLARVRLDDHPKYALTTLLTRFDELLEGKIRRIEALARQARSGYVLHRADIGWELDQTWGADVWPLLAPGNRALHGPACDALRPDPREALPAVRVWATAPDESSGPEAQHSRPARRETESWTPRRDLLSSGPRDRHLVGESDDDGVLTLRFGSGGAGAEPPPGRTLLAEYRTGNGRAGNVGREAICLVSSGSAELSAVTRVSNPLPATGGTDPEPVADVRIAAPREAFRRLRRAVTAEDYAALAGLRPGVQRAAATLRWTGSWYEADIALDALGSADVPRPLLEEVRQELHRFRHIGHDVVTGPAVHVPLDVALDVTVEPGHIAGHVRRDVRRELRPGRLPDGRLGFFDPDTLTFGTPVRVSRLVAAVAGLPGVRHVEVTRLGRLHAAVETTEPVPASGLLRLRPLEIARLDDDPARPENGRLTLNLRGGR